MDDDKLGGITEAGKELLQQIIEEDNALVFTRIQFGAGKYQVRPGVPIRATKLVDPVFGKSGLIFSFLRDGKIRISTKFNTEILGISFWLNEIGVFARKATDSDDVLFYYSIDPSETSNIFMSKDADCMHVWSVTMDYDRATKNRPKAATDL